MIYFSLEMFLKKLFDFNVKEDLWSFDGYG
jgi:hypothetical protein